MKKILFLVFVLLPRIAWCQNLTIEQFKAKEIEIINVKPELNILIISGFDPSGKVTTEKVALEQGEVLAIWTRYLMPKLSILTIPFKVRSKQGDLPQSVTTALTNAGVNVGLLNGDLDRYFVDGSKSSHKFSLGLLVAPTGEELKPDNTNGGVSTTSKQLFISTGLSINYTVNDISFSFIPVGMDYATTTQGKKWVYNKERWWGFGIGITTKLLGL